VATRQADGVLIREASPRDHLGVMQVIDGANLELSAETVERRIEADRVLVADDDNRIVGALVTVARDDGAHVEAVAVRRRRRGQGIGSGLVEAAAEHWTPLTAEFDPDVRPFYDDLGFDVEERGERRWGELE
jgi:GNAT superfamily N-acetyltransferase